MITNNAKPLATAKPATLGTGTETASLEKKTGVARRIGVKMATSKMAANGLRQVEAYKVATEVGIAKLAIEGAGRVIGAAIAKDAVSKLGAVTVALNNETAVVHMALTNARNGEIASHIDNRHQNFALADQLHSAGKMDDQEYADFRRLIEVGASSDIDGTLLRAELAKAAVNTLHSHALGGIQKSESDLKP